MRGLYKPPGLPRINWSHPLAYGLVDLWVTNGQVPFNLTGRTGPLSNMSSTPKGGRPTPSGQGEVFSSDLRWGPNTGPSGRIALMTWAVQSGNTAAYMLGYGNSAAGNYLLGLNNGGAATGLQVVARNTAGNNATATSASGIITNGVAFVGAANTSWNAGDLPSLYLDGNPLAVTSNAFGTSTTDTGNVASIGGIWRGSISSPYNGIIFMAARWARWLTSAEHFLLGTDPTAFLIFPKDDVLAQMVGAGSGGTVYNVSFIDGAVSSDVLTARLTAAASTAEQSGSSDTVAGSLTITLAVAENIATSDAVANTAALTDGITETSVTSDIASNTAALAAGITESAITADSEAVSTPGADQVIGETAASSDAFSATLTIHAGLAEAVTAQDAVAAVQVMLAGLSETMTTEEAYSTILHALCGISDVAPTSDELLAGQLYEVGLDEGADTADAVVAASGALIAIPCNILSGQSRVRTLSGASRVRMLAGGCC